MLILVRFWSKRSSFNHILYLSYC